MIVLLMTVYAGEIRRLVGTGPLFISAVVGGAFLLGYVLGGPAKRTREVLPTAARKVAIALLIATRVSATRAFSPSSSRSDSSVSSFRILLRVSGAGPEKRGHCSRGN
jgi:hypothetical protein